MRHAPAVGYFWVPAAADYATNISLVTLPGLSPQVNSKVITKDRGSGRAYGFKDARLLLASPTFKLKPELAEHTTAISFPGQVNLYRKKMPVCLVNAVDAPTSTKSNLHQERMNLRSNYDVIQDSGGFQIISKRVEFIDPADVVRLHNEYADYGVCLDVPAGPFNPSDKDTERLGVLLGLNNDVMLSKLAKGTHLINVSHGKTLSQRRLWLRGAHRKNIKALCVAGLRSYVDSKGFFQVPPETFAAHLLFCVLYERVPFYHVLGTSTIWQMALMARVAWIYKVLITSDSASYKQLAISGKYYGWGNVLNKVGPPARNHEPIACSCPFCRKFRYTFVYQDYTSAMIHHNAWYLVEQSTLVNSLAHLPTEDFLRSMSQEFPGFKKNNPTFEKAVRLIDSNPSIKSLERSSFSFRTKTANALFNTTSAEVARRHKQLEAIFQRYSEYHRTKI